jgi:thiamine pyrophosphokinase
MTALIIGNGIQTDANIIKKINYDYVICVDGGLASIKSYGITPDVIIGDFDSVDLLLLKEYELQNVPIEKFPSEKNFTDMELALEFAVSKGFYHIMLTGASGSRLDHTLGNLMLMEKYYNKGIHITVIDNNNEMKIISDNSEIALDYTEGYYISIIPLTDTIQGLDMEGFKYPLCKVDVQRGSTLCISNQITGKQGKIRLQKGTAILFKSKD